jgi:hypothetical protein
MVKALGGVAVLLTATAVLAVALGGNPFHNSAPPSRTARELAAAARAQCGGKQAIPACVRLVSEKIRLDYRNSARAQCGGKEAAPACVRLVSEKIRFDHRRSVRTQCGGRQAEPACIRLIGQGIGAHS